jgi:hypothetical protein
MILVIDRIKALTTKRTRAQRGREIWDRGDEIGLEVAFTEYHQISVEQVKRFVLNSLDRFKMPSFPKRPYRFPIDDEGLLERLREARGSKKLADTETLREFGIWRQDVFNAEAQARGNLTLLLSHIWHAEEAGADEIAYELRRFVANEYGVTFEGIESLTLNSVHHLAEIYSRRRDLFSERLMPDSGRSNRNWKVPAGHPVYSDPDEEPEQLGIYGDV